MLLSKCRNPGVVDDLLQHGKATNIYLQFKGYNSDSSKVNGLVKEREAKVAALRTFPSLLMSKSATSATVGSVMDAAPSKPISTNDKRRKSARNKK